MCGDFNMCDFVDLQMDLDTNSSNMTNATMSQNKREEKQVLDAAELSLKTGSMTPLLKQELRYSILIRRNSEGKSEINVEFKDPTPSELTDYEKEKKLRRREQNRMAAIRFRQKNKTRGSSLVQEVDQLQAENDRLKNIVTQLKRERHSLMEKFKDHLQCCNLNPLQSDCDILYSRH